MGLINMTKYHDNRHSHLIHGHDARIIFLHCRKNDYYVQYIGDRQIKTNKEKDQQISETSKSCFCVIRN